MTGTIITAPTQDARTTTPPAFLLVHIPTNDIDRKVLGAHILLEGRPFTHPTVTSIRRRIMISRLTHLPSLLVVAASALVIIDLTASGAAPLTTWPFVATLAVISGWAAAITYFATFRTVRTKAFTRCAVLPISTIEPDLPHLLTRAGGGTAKLTHALCKRGIMEGEKLNHDAAHKQLSKLAATLR